MAKQDEYVRYTIRVPKEVFEPLEKAAHEENRSVNAEIISRLAFSIEFPPHAVREMAKQNDALNADIEIMEGDLCEQAQELRRTAYINTALKSAIDETDDAKKSLMYRVLSYLDDIPPDLAIWAYDVIQMVDGNDILKDQLKGIELSEADVRQRLAAKREEFRERTLQMIRSRLSENDLVDQLISADESSKGTE